MFDWIRSGVSAFAGWIKARAGRGSSGESMTLDQLVDFLNLGGVSSDKLSEATYFACLKILAENIGKLPFKVQRMTEKDGVIKEYKHPLYSVIGTRPNPYMTATHFWSTLEYNRNHHGNAYAWILWGGESITLWPLPSDNVNIWIDNKGVWGRQNAVWYVFTCTKTGERYKIANDSILHLKGSTSFDGILGKSVRDVLRSTIEGNLKGQAMLNSSYENGFTGKAVLHYTGGVSDPLEKVYVEKMEEYMSGKNQRIIPMPLGTSLTPVNMKLADNQFVELKKYSALQIAAAFGIKPSQINDYEKSSYASAEAQNLSFYVDTLLYILKQYEEETTYKLLPVAEQADGYYTKFNVSVILRADQKTQMESLRTAVAGGIYTPNEARKLLDKGSKEGGDELYANGNIIPLSMAGEQYKRGKAD